MRQSILQRQGDNSCQFGLTVAKVISILSLSFSHCPYKERWSYSEAFRQCYDPHPCVRDRIKNYKDGPGALIDTQQT